MSKVNLDALIPREDFEIEESTISGTKKNTISIEDLKSEAFFFLNLRKPDFQRETNEWDGKKICQLLESFLDGELIPALILWRSTGGYVFVIDGAHRLSSLAAWINDDYGNGQISKEFFDGIIPEEQQTIHEKTKKVIDENIGSYDDFKLALKRPDKVREDIVTRSKNLASLAIQLQWVEGNAEKAENSFFKINQQAAPIDKTELKLIESRKNANSIAARAVIRSGTGHKYWSKFNDEIQKEITNLAQQVNKLFFLPRLETPVRTLDIPLGGKLSMSSALPLILDFINITNGLDTKFSEDKDGNQTIFVLKKALKILQTINSIEPGSLGLHPAVYFYSKDGRLKVAMIYAIAGFVMILEEKKKKKEFIKVRKQIEEIIYEYDYVIQQINRKYRSALASYIYIAEFLYNCQEELLIHPDLSVALNKVLASQTYFYINLAKEEPKETESSKFNESRKSAVFIKSALENIPKCKICDTPIHKNSISIDHIGKKSAGGKGTVLNGQLTHPFCNTGVKG